MEALKLMAAGCVLLTVGLFFVGKFANNEGEKLRVEAREVRQERREMFDLALQQSRAAQHMARMRMEAQMAEFEAYENYENFEDYENFAEMQYLQAQQYNRNY